MARIDILVSRARVAVRDADRWITVHGNKEGPGVPVKRAKPARDAAVPLWKRAAMLVGVKV